MKIAVVTDAWSPQVNGVVRTLKATVAELGARGHKVEAITPDGFATLPCPSYPEIRLAIAPRAGLRRRLDAFAADAVHIATEGPLGWSARRWCLDRAVPFTTSFHTRFPDYVQMRTGIDAGLFWRALRRFHSPAARVFAATQTLEAELGALGLSRVHRWTRGVDTVLFRPDGPRLPELDALPGPVLLHVGRVAPEKNVEAFLAAPVAGSKVVVGDGPALPALRKRFGRALFLGRLEGARLAAAYRTADVFVFPSRTDTFGLVMAEALASGVPVAAHPVPGPNDVIGPDAAIGVLHEDLSIAIGRALTLDRDTCAAAACRFSWSRCTDEFLDGLSLIERRETEALTLAKRLSAGVSALFPNSRAA